MSATAVAGTISGLNVKIGADLTDLKKEVSTVGTTIEDSLGGENQQPVKDLSENFNTAATKAAATAVSVAVVAAGLVKVGKTILGWTKGIVEDAIATSPETKANVEAVSTAFESLKVSLGETLLPLINQYAPVITNLMNNLATWIRENPEAAKNLLLVAGAIGALAAAAGVALPIMTMFQVTMISISASTLGVAGIIVGLIAVLAILSGSLGEIEAEAAATAEHIAELQPDEQIVENRATGLFEVVEYEYELVPVWNEEAGDYVETLARWDPNKVDIGFGQWTTQEEDLAAASASASAALEEQQGVIDSLAESVGVDPVADMSESLDDTTTAAGEAQGVLEQMQQTIDTMNASAAVMSTDDMATSMETVSSLLESEAFQQFASQPIDPSVGESWEAFGTSVNTAATGFGSMTEAVAEESPLSVGLAAMKTKIDDLKSSATTLGDYLSGGLVYAIDALMRHVCMTDVNAEGEIDASGGNTLYTGWGWIHVLFQDIYNDSVLIAEYWNGSFIDAAENLRSCGATSTVMGMAHAASDATLTYNALTAAIYGLIDALLELRRVRGGGSKGAGTGVNGVGTREDLFKAGGGPVHAGAAYVVGEYEPEIFVPDVDGTIVPMHDVTGRGMAPVTVNFNGDVIGDERSIYSLVHRAVKAGIREEVNAAV